MKLTVHNRRNFLRGTLGGAAVTVGLPLLDCFFDANGVALAASGTAPPVCFGTWFWGCGMTPGLWEPAKLGSGYEMAEEMAPLTALRHKINVYSGMDVLLDGRPNVTHLSGAAAPLTGVVPANGSGLGLISGDLPTIDSLVADRIGAGTRFRSLEVSCTRKPTDTYSSRGGNTVNASEISPLALYMRVFGEGFRDPNAGGFKPDPETLVRRSSLSAVSEERAELMKQLGAADRARVEDYFTSLRQLEQKLDLELREPEHLAACSVPGKSADGDQTVEISTTHSNQRLFGELLAHALACGQTRVFNVVFSQSLSMLRRPGVSEGHHQRTHEEPSDPALGYQRDCSWFVRQSMEGLATMLRALDGVREGDRTLLDRTLVFALSDVSNAKVHSVNNMTFITAGSAAGRLRTGYHVTAPGETVNRVGLTVQQALGMPLNSWGSGASETSKAFAEILV